MKTRKQTSGRKNYLIDDSPEHVARVVLRALLLTGICLHVRDISERLGCSPIRTTPADADTLRWVAKFIDTGKVDRKLTRMILRQPESKAASSRKR